jgi:ADP-ribosylglycohydrolase
MSYTIKWETPSGPGSLSVHTAADAFDAARAAIIAGELESVTDSNGAALTIEALELLAKAEATSA